uniref:Uncharacterized protein n=1 Tax=Arundo donax TaxID=35708 RepID=A0A0A9A983_ARUDO
MHFCFPSKLYIYYNPQFLLAFCVSGYYCTQRNTVR